MLSNSRKQNEILAKSYGKKGLLVTLILAISFVFNVLALWAPFTRLGSLFSSTLSCSLPYSAYLMWDESLYFIAILVVLFSILFPFVKLSCLVYIWLIGKNKEKRNTALKIVEPLGKWSMLDVFATCIVLILCNKQILIYGSPMIGVDFFLAAIFLSIIASIIIDQLHDAGLEKKDSNHTNCTKDLIFSSFWYKLFVVIGLFVSLIVLIVAIIYPYLVITSFLLISYSYSIFDSVIALSNVSLVLSIFMLLTMIVFPILHNISMLLCYILKLFAEKEYRWLARLIKIFSRFNMLDVFLLGFVIFLVEGEAMVEIEHRLGIVLIALFIFIVLVVPQIIAIIRKVLYSRQLRKSPEFLHK